MLVTVAQIRIIVDISSKLHVLFLSFELGKNETYPHITTIGRLCSKVANNFFSNPTPWGLTLKLTKKSQKLNFQFFPIGKKCLHKLVKLPKFQVCNFKNKKSTPQKPKKYGAFFAPFSHLLHFCTILSMLNFQKHHN